MLERSPPARSRHRSVLGAGRSPRGGDPGPARGFEGPLGLLLSLIEARQLDVLTVPLGALAGAYLDALAGLDADRIGNVSGFVAIAGQLILIKSRAMLPRPVEPGDAPPDEAPDPEAALRARLIALPGTPRGRARASRRGALERVGLFRREPAVAAAAARQPGPSPRPARRSIRLGSRRDRAAAPGRPAAAEPPPETMPRGPITIAQRAELIRAALRGADRVVLQELLRGVRDRVVMAVTFLAMLELMKRREIVVEQAEPWGPIVARATTRRGAGRGRRRRADETRSTRPWSRSRDRPRRPRPGRATAEADRHRRRPAPPIGLTEARARGAAVRGRAAAVAARDRHAGRAWTGRRSTRGSAISR